MSNTPEYHAYEQARDRCRNPNNKFWKDYGGRGIEFRFTDFMSWFKEVGFRPSPEMMIDRKNNDGHYEPGNMRWATRSEQQKNRRRIRKQLRTRCKKNLHELTPENILPKNVCRQCKNATERRNYDCAKRAAKYLKRIGAA